MNDPHIDIDEIDNPQPTAPELGDSTLPKEPAGGFGFTDLLERMGQQASRWQDRLTAGAKMGLDMHIVPPEAKKHMLSSQREFLLAWRALIDYSLEKLENQEQREAAKAARQSQGQAEPPKATKIQVEEYDI